MARTDRDVIHFARLLVQPLVRAINSCLKYAISNFENPVGGGEFERPLARVPTNQVEAWTLRIPAIVIAPVAPDFVRPSASVIAAAFVIARHAYAAVSLADIPHLCSGVWIVGFTAWLFLAAADMSPVAQ